MSTYSSTNWIPFGFDLRYAPSIPLDFVVGQRQHDKMWSLEGTVIIERLQASLQDAHDNLREAQDGQNAEVRRSQRPCGLHVGDFVILGTREVPISYANEYPSRWKLHDPWAAPYKIIRFSGPNVANLELLADMTIHDTVNVGIFKKYTGDRCPDDPPPPPISTVGKINHTIERLYTVAAITSHKQELGIKGPHKY